MARLTWTMLVLTFTGLAAVGFVRAFRNPVLVEMPPLAEVFASLGLDERLMIVVALVAPFVVVASICWIVFWRRSHDPMALLFTATLLALFTYSSRTLLTFGGALRHSLSVAFALAMAGLALILALFPDGRFVPPSARWLPLAMGGLLLVLPDSGRMLMGLADGKMDPTIRTAALVVGWSALLVLGLAAQVHRFRHVSGSTERQQTKWVVVPLGLIFALFLVVLWLPIVRPGVSDRWVGWGLLLIVPAGLLFPVMVANAVLRYRLYEIDRVISRTVSYGIVLSILGAVYGVGVLGLGTAISALPGEGGSDLIVAGSVLAVIALFHPIRSRVQRAVDRRFNRTGYEARLAVTAFTESLRHEVSLDVIRDGLAAVAERAVQPVHVSVWLAGGPGGDRFPRDRRVPEERSGM